ncbi:hypothetical protein ACOSP7_016921 [Xanthoceras sorbifolium]|uniref:Uncharacterized protein n=1 Tax=Xanthoceras sorbifolium TaxID=99658 RepID=A0ABQ8HI64_9ROSI|nr:hypothetical protein JRO89_XS10G0087800 [Xanthoceras sorbifolium]
MSRHRRQVSQVLPPDLFGSDDPQPPPPPPDSIQATTGHQHGPTGPVSNAPAADHHQQQSSDFNSGAAKKKPSPNKPS